MAKLFIAFLLGFAFCWLSAMLTAWISEEDLDVDILLMMPLFAIITPIYALWLLLYNPWRFVIHPVSAEKFTKWQEYLKNGKQTRITKNLWFCIDSKGNNILHKFFFVRVK